MNDKEIILLQDIYEVEKRFVNNLKNRRKELNMTQEELAKKTGLSQQVISDIENHERKPTLINVIRFLRGLELDINDIFKQ